jgi:2-polyprenyl-3-methyl-5-hydroxy-6-metoxy-1,4-benzoquinol methylase
MLPSEPRYVVEENEDELADKYRLVLEEVGSNRDVLELGCYDGSFSRHLVARQNRVVGVDYVAAAVQQAASVCAAAYQCDLNEPEELFSGPLKGRRFAMILLMDVLEHIVFPEHLLAHLSAHLEPGGTVIVTLPNIAFWGIRKMLLQGNFNYGDVGILDRSHLRFYTFATACEFLEGAGFRIERWEPLSYQAPLVGRLRLRCSRLTRPWVRRFEGFLARSFPNFYCMQFYFRLTPA